MPPMNHIRHGTQAIVSGQGVYVAAGSPERGRGKQKNMEVYSKDAPVGVESTAGVLSAPNMTEISIGKPKSVMLEHVAGNQGVFVQSISLSGQSASDFVLTSSILDLVLIGQGSKLEVLVKYTGSTDGAEAQLDVTLSGHQSMRVKLVGWTLTIDSGSTGENKSIVTGNTWTYDVSSSIKIDNTDTPAYFRSHRLGRNFSYTINALTPGEMYKVSLSFAEIYQPNCRKGTRIINIIINGKVVDSDLDVYKAVGCKTALVETYPMTANTKGQVTIEVSATKEKAMVSKIHIVGIRDEPVPPFILIVSGAVDEDASAVTGKTWTYEKSSSVEIGGTKTPSYFRTHRSGRSFSYTIDALNPGKKYEVSLGFAEIYKPNFRKGKRIMSMSINGEVSSQIWMFSQQQDAKLRSFRPMQ